MQNFEYKAELRDPELARLLIRRAGAIQVGTFSQVDTYYHVSEGRLKRRECEGEPTEWVVYHRPNQLEPRLSEFTIYSNADALQRYGRAGLAERAVVRKRRELWLQRNVRIHLDEVEGLGRFIELEAMLTPTLKLDACRESLGRLLEMLAPAMGEPISDSYGDIAERESEPAPRSGSDADS